MATTVSQLNPSPIHVDCKHGKVEELTDAISQHSDRLHRIALHHLGNLADAEDAVQDAVLSALKNIHQFLGQAAISTWLTTIVINSSRMMLRRRLRSMELGTTKNDDEQDLLEEIVSDKRPTPEEAYFKLEFAETVARATSRLPHALRTTFHLRSVDGLSLRETAQILGVPVGAVKAGLSRGRVRLRRMMRGSTRRRDRDFASYYTPDSDKFHQRI